MKSIFTIHKIATTPNIFILLHYLAVKKEILLLDLYINISQQKNTKKEYNIG